MRTGPHEPLTEAQRAIIVENMPLACNQAQRFRRQGAAAGLALDDLIAEAYLLLTVAVRGYVPERCPLSAYLRICLRRGLHRLVRTGGVIATSHHIPKEQRAEVWSRTKVSSAGSTLDCMRGSERTPLENLIEREELAQRQLDAEDAAFRRSVRAAAKKLAKRRDRKKRSGALPLGT
jgi:RNA polymerase sigma factor (sigma-70 family)